MTESRASQFERLFDRPPAGAVRAPGRVNLIGEHTDYNDGFVLPIAIEREVTAAYAPGAGRAVRFHSLHAGWTLEVNLDDDLSPRPGAWSNYPLGVLVELLRAGAPLTAADVLFDSTIPVGGGLSSSAALEVATALALLAAAGTNWRLDDDELAYLCRRAENDFAGAPCGIMDQSIVVMAETGKAMLLDCRSGAVGHVPFDDPGVVLLVADTQVAHDIGDGGYPLRRRQCEAAAGQLGVRALRDVPLERLVPMTVDDILPPDLAKRCLHVVSEIARTREAADVLKRGDHERFGELMYASHRSLRDDFEVSCAELDAIVETAQRCEGVFGARMTGGGFGGCAIVLARRDSAAAVIEAIAAEFDRRFGRRCPIFATGAAAGAGPVE